MSGNPSLAQQYQYQMSITKQLPLMGLKGRPEDLISSIYLDHEQAHRRPSAMSRSLSQQAVVQMPLSIPGTINYPAPTQSLPVTGLHHPTYSTGGNEVNSHSYNPESSRIRSVSVPSSVVEFQRSHFKPLAQAAKCADPNCRKLFTRRERRRNCSMCGDVFCKRCTNYRRKLSPSAAPDPLGTFYSVCCKCFNQQIASGCFRDLMGEFAQLRRVKVLAETTEATKPHCGSRNSSAKQNAMMNEVPRLMNGFSSNPGFWKGLKSEFKIPDWQKSENWVETRCASECYQCKKVFTKMSRKVNCRIGGQVFCKECSKDEIVVYLEEREGEPKWGINGKSGGPTTTPVRFEMYPVCSRCSVELQSMLLEHLTKSSNQTSDSFMDNVYRLHQSLSKLQEKVVSWLPEYEQVVESMDVEDNSPRSIKDQHPLRKLAKAQSDLSDALSELAVESQKLKLLRPQTPLEERLVKHVMIGTYQFYQEHMYHFRCMKQRLAEHTPHEHLVEIQKVLSQQSMERVHIVVQQLIFEALNLEKCYKFDSSFFADIVQIIRAIEDEFKPFLEARGESWEQHSEVVLMFIKSETKSSRSRIKLSQETLTSPEYVKYVVISQCSSVVHECYRELEAKTMDREFRKTKKSLDDARMKLDIALIQPNSAS